MRRIRARAAFSAQQTGELYGRKTKTVISIESHRLTVVRSRGSIEMWCKRCGKEVSMLTPEVAAALEGVGPRTICCRIERGELHFIHAGD